MPVFICKLKQDRAGMKKGTTIQVSTPSASCDAYKIKEVLEAQFGKKAAEANHPDYREIYKFLMSKILVLFFLFTFGLIRAQFIEPLNEEYICSSNEMVDESLMFEISPGTLPVGKDKLPVIYYELLREEKEFMDCYGASPAELFPIKNPKTGVTAKTKFYNNPNIYYAILDLPNNNGRFYGAITCGYNTIEYIMQNPESKWHPYTEVILLVGTVVRPDGTKEEFQLYDKRTLKESKPTGSYWLNDALGFTDINFKFNAVGNGEIIAYKKMYDWVLLPVSKQSTSYWEKGQYKSFQQHSGGYKVWMNQIARRPFKWKINDSGEIIITPYGNAVPSIEEGIKETANSELNQQHKNDFPTNEEAIYIRKMYKYLAKKNLEAFDEIIIHPSFITKSEIFGDIEAKVTFKENFFDNSKISEENWRLRIINDDRALTNDIKKGISKQSTYFSPRRPQLFNLKTIVTNEFYMDLSVLYFTNLDAIERKTIKTRKKGVPKEKIIYNQMVNEIKDAIKRYSEIFEDPDSYNVEDVNPNKKTAMIFFTKPDKLMYVDVKFNDKGKIDLEVMRKSKVEKNAFQKKLNIINSQNEEIMAFMNQKKCKKELKKYKEYATSFLAMYPKHFKTLDDIHNILSELNEFIKYQNTVFEKLKSLTLR